MDVNGFEYNIDQVAEIYAKLEMAKIMMAESTRLMQEAETAIKFYRITNEAATE
jgi:hypothetical protein